MDDTVKTWLGVLTQSKVPVESAQARAILWLAIGHAALELRAAIRADESAAPSIAKANPATAKAKTRGRKASPKSTTGQVLAAIQAGARDYKALSAMLPKVPAKYFYRAADQLVKRGAITRERVEGGVRLAVR